ncbi:response regulator [Desulfatibacillum aliphaticivorans]|uniref:response regulator n=1 Tax=Desulfatibacillum aliphaticivorans TaxID=218208 RepID=UPI000429A7FC|nr:response regulator [Desulfatibacillum aliphaticivorans]
MGVRIAIVDDEATVCKRLTSVLEVEGFETEAFQTAKPFLDRMGRRAFDVVFLDLSLPDMNGMQVLSQLKAGCEDVEIIIITGQGTIESAV